MTTTRPHIALVTMGVKFGDETSGYTRFRILAKLLVEQGFSVDLITSSFQHWEKAQRELGRAIYQQEPFAVVFIEEPGYKRNIDLKRIKSHRVAAENLARYFESHRGRYDLIYAEIPPNDVARVCAEAARDEGIPFVADINDLWPEAMRMVVDFPVISDALFHRFSRDARVVYELLDAAVGTSDEYASRPARDRSKPYRSRTVYVGNDLAAFDRGVKAHLDQIPKAAHEFWLVYAGTLGTSYDLETLITAVNTLKGQMPQIRLKILGDGPDRAVLTRMASKLGAPVDFLGYVDHGLMAAYLAKADLTINSLVRRAPQSIVTKIGDYLASGTPMINTGASPEFRRMVETEGFGLNVEAEDPDALAGAILSLAADPERRHRMGLSARAMAEREFDQARSYLRIVDLIQELLAEDSSPSEAALNPAQTDATASFDTPSGQAIPFSPPDISEDEIEAVVHTLKSGWITTGPQTKAFERELAAFTGAQCVATFFSATNALEMALRALGIGEGDEVITTAYTYTASASPVCHVGAKLVLCDTAADSFEMDYERLPELITERTRAIIPVDIAGRPCDYDRLYAALDQAKDRWRPATRLQEQLDRPLIIADAAHALGASYRGIPAGCLADFTVFSFHAVKNLTTAEGGALAWRPGGFDGEAFYRQLMLLSLHGQSKDALSKSTSGSWEYDVLFPGWKCNMTDVQAAMGRAQLKRYPALLARRRSLIERYERNLATPLIRLLPHYDDSRTSSGHLMLTRVVGCDLETRARLIEALGARGIAGNVHYKPLPLLTAYHELGFSIADYPQAYRQYTNEITLPLHTQLSDADVDYICEVYLGLVEQLDRDERLAQAE